MQSDIIVAIASLAFFFVVLISKRRFGLLAFALAAGFMLSGIWALEASFILSALNIQQGGFVTFATAAVITIAPAVVLSFSGKKYKNLLARIVGSAALVIVALAILAPQLQSSLSSHYGLLAAQWLNTNRGMVIGAGLILATLELLFTRTPHHKPEHEHGSKH